MSADRLNLSGEWSGVYSYPGALPPVSFSASLSDNGGWLSGVISEDGSPPFPSGRRQSSLQGRRVGVTVSWLKTYEHREVIHDVAYEGAVSGDGEEISGRWSIVGDWSGAFLMVRQSRRAEARRRRAATRA